ncbi:MAG: outer membrane protein assembly factor BamD [Gemmatimonadetes bacterium]|nr:outer membrane protein assembly factor BamD [Gemmatimonadota bacterium]
MTASFPSFLSRIVLVVLVGVAGACASTSRWEGLTATQLFEMGRIEFEAEEYGDASETLERLILGAPGFSQAAEAQLMLARAYFRSDQYILAQSEFTRFIDRFPAHPQAPDAALGVCRSNEALSPIAQRDQTFTMQAVTVCQNVASDWQGTPAAEQAAEIVREMRDKLAEKQYDNGAYYLRRNVPDAAILYWQELLEAFPETDWAPTALAGIIEAYTRIGYDDEVATATERLLNEYPESPEARALGDGGGSGGEAGVSGGGGAVGGGG